MTQQKLLKPCVTVILLSKVRARMTFAMLRKTAKDAVKQLALECDLLLVVGSPNSSNSNRLKELAERLGCDSYLIDSVDDMEDSWFEGKSRFGITAGASAPEVLVQQVVKHLQRNWPY